MNSQLSFDQHSSASTRPPSSESGPGADIALQAMGPDVPGPETRTSQPEFQSPSLQKRQELRAGLERMLSAKGPAKNTFEELHSLVREAIGDTSSYVAHQLEQPDVQAIRALEACLRDTAEVEKIGRSIIEMLDKLDKLDKLDVEKQTWSDWAKEKGTKYWNWAGDRVDSGTAKSIGLAGAAMAFKNLAWYIPRAISMHGVSPGATGALAWRIAARWGVANVAAASLEYPTTVGSQRTWKGLGNSQNTLGGISQWFDMFSALVALKFTGDKINGPQIGALLGAAAAAMTTAGMLNDLARGFHGGNNAGEVTDIENLPVEPDSAERGAGDEEQGVELDSAERGAGDEEQGPAPPKGNEARRQAAKLRNLTDAFPEPGLKARSEQLGELASRVENLEETMRRVFPTMENLGQTMRRVFPTEDSRIAHVNQALKAFAEYRDNIHQLVDNPGQENTAEGESVAAQTNKVDHLLEEMREIKTDLEERGGKDPKTIAFLAGMASTYLGLFVAGNIGGRVKSTSLQNLNVRATLLAVGSVPFQTIANLGHLFLTEKHLDWLSTKTIIPRKYMSTAVAIGLTPGEFVPLQWGIALADLAKSLAGKVPEAPKQNWPSLTQVRSFQEATRQAINFGFNALVLRQKIKPQHILGLGVNLATAAATATVGGVAAAASGGATTTGATTAAAAVAARLRSLPRPQTQGLGLSR